MPYFGLGTFQAEGDKCAEAIEFVLTHDHDLIDTAQAYENQGYDSAKYSIEQSLERPQTDYIDLLLIHWPYPGDFERSLETWHTLIALQAAGKTRAIGVSNSTIDLVQKTIEDSGVVPAVNQVEFHPVLFQVDLMDYCQQKGVLI
ncbi:MAG: aldo/keto reductase [Chloroflexota bacterium]|nr:aldo/keto reductase [Chloroflexota bacterium]